MPSTAKSRWLALSALLDELLDLDAPRRAERVAAVRERDPALANDVQALLDREAQVDSERFLERPAVLEEFGHLQRADSLSRIDTGIAAQTVGAYTLERQIGRGGMGSVWLARRTDGRYEGKVAIKFLNPELIARGGAERFAREGSILARLEHPNIARLLDAGVTADGGQPYLVLEYVDGVPISTYCEEHRLGVQARVRLFLDVLAAVAHAHNRLILHRDLKPSNILVNAEGQVKLLDFGIAKLLDDAGEPVQATEVTKLAGHAFTVQYASPEQLQSGDVTAASDVYSLGVLLYVLLGGVHPTAGSTVTPLDQMRAVVETQPRRLSDSVLHRTPPVPGSGKLARELRGDLDNIVAHALKKLASQRYANAAELADDLRRYLNHEPVLARPDALPYRLGKFVRRHRVGLAAATVATVALAAGTGVALLEAREAKRQRVQAEGLIEFMLGDLRKKLEPVGRLEALDGVGVQALAYYAAQDPDGLDADSLGRRARALHLIGDIAERRGSLDEAMKTFRQAADTTGELLTRSPNDTKRLFDHAQSVYWVGYIERRRGELAEAEKMFSQYQHMARRLVQLEPNNPEWLHETAQAGINVGVVHLERARPEQALSAFGEVRDVWARIAQTRPEVNLDLAHTLGWIAKAREAMGQYGLAIESQQAKIDVLGRMPNAAQSRNVQKVLANASYEIGRLRLMSGQPDAALLAARHAVSRLKALVAVDPTNTEWLSHEAFAQVSLAEVLIASGDPDSGREHLGEASAALAQLLATDATRNKWNISLRGHLLLQRHALGAGQGPSRQELDEVLAQAARVEAGRRPLDPDQTLVVSSVQIALGDLLAREGAASSREQWEKAARRLRSSTTAQDPAVQTLLGHAHARLGNTDEARSLMQAVERSSYRHPAYAELRRRLNAATGAAPVQ